jgi:endonuclease III
LAPIIGTICDEKIKAEIAWNIPYNLYEFLKRKGLEFKPSTICTLRKEELRKWLASHMCDKWPKKLSEKEREEWLNKISIAIVDTCEKIWKEYNDDPDNIFTINNGNLSIPIIYFALRQFPGIGPKKASMIARDFGRNSDWFKSVKVRLLKRGINLTVTNIHFTEMPIDVHVRRVFRRLGFARYNQPQDFQNLARIIYPENPGLVDDLIWQLGREVCKNYPICVKCPLSNICEYKGEK